MSSICLKCGGRLQKSSNKIGSCLICESCGSQFTECSKCGQPIDSQKNYTHDGEIEIMEKMKQTPLEYESNGCTTCRI